MNGHQLAIAATYAVQIAALLVGVAVLLLVVKQEGRRP